ncbi:hypothetical protein ElyMa_000717900 [Elysia marginata]|uniref:Uncharacterized protein n=1 Tax=Elysia marginata TaxID=1093978 RepID=A0AAV4GMM1_9GAST|nr:hypothetical protein ElyMa_000717900 [Elysia marginata]
MVVQNSYFGAAGGTGIRNPGTPQCKNPPASTFRATPSGCNGTLTNSGGLLARSPLEDGVDVDMTGLRLDQGQGHGAERHLGHGNCAYLLLDGGEDVDMVESPPRLQFTPAAGVRDCLTKPGRAAKRHSWDLSISSRYERWVGESGHPAHRDAHLAHPRTFTHGNGSAALGPEEEEMPDGVLYPATQKRYSSAQLPPGIRFADNGDHHHQEDPHHHRDNDSDEDDDEDHRPRVYHQPRWSQGDILTTRTVGQEAKLSNRKLWLQREQELYVQAVRLKRT